MLKIANISIVAILVGVTLHVLLGAAWHTSFRSSNFFISFVIALISGLAVILPGFVTGLVAGQRGLVHGVLLAVGIFLYTVAKVFFFRGASIGHAFDTGLLVLSLAAVAQCIVACLAGVAVRRNGLFY